MKELLKSGLKTFLPTLAVVGGGWLMGIVISKLLIWLVETQGVVITTIVFFSLLFLFIWGANAYSDYRLQKALKKIDEEHAEMMKTLRQPKK